MAYAWRGAKLCFWYITDGTTFQKTALKQIPSMLFLRGELLQVKSST